MLYLLPDTRLYFVSFAGYEAVFCVFCRIRGCILLSFAGYEAVPTQNGLVHTGNVDVHTGNVDVHTGNVDVHNVNFNPSS